MANNKNDKIKEAEIVNNKTMEDRIDEAIESLKAQFNNFSKVVEENTFNKAKCQGALEVLLQLRPQENDGEGS